ncbi:hypothetical protein TcWFU_001613 [Taenia crassiceps]|uniref:Uncharacterized protein n=1 Tax=Taenia crassiceps TaxID=6207 RepID=A0ABR4QPA7_9CEST
MPDRLICVKNWMLPLTQNARISASSTPPHAPLLPPQAECIGRVKIRHCLPRDRMALCHMDTVEGSGWRSSQRAVFGVVQISHGNARQRFKAVIAYHRNLSHEKIAGMWRKLSPEK